MQRAGDDPAPSHVFTLQEAAMSCTHQRSSRLRTLWPVGALLAYFILMPFMSPVMMGCILAGVAGIMVFISIDELLPAAREYGEAHISIYGVMSGMAIMALSLILLG